MASVIVLVSLVHSTVLSGRVSYVSEAVFKETLEAVDVMFAPASDYRDVQKPSLQAVGTRVWFDHGHAVLDGGQYAHHLVQLARPARWRH